MVNGKLEVLGCRLSFLLNLSLGRVTKTPGLPRCVLVLALKVESQETPMVGHSTRGVYAYARTHARAHARTRARAHTTDFGIKNKCKKDHGILLFYCLHFLLVFSLRLGLEVVSVWRSKQAMDLPTTTLYIISKQSFLPTGYNKFFSKKFEV